MELNILYRKKQAQSHWQTSQALITSSRHCPLSTMQEALLDMIVLVHTLCVDSWHCCHVCARRCLTQLCRALLLTSNCIAETCPAEIPPKQVSHRTKTGKYHLNRSHAAESETMVKYGKCHSPEMKLVLISLWHSSQGMKMAEELDSVMRLDVMHPIAKHF